jgi:DNA-binding FrmR family transcriptional regulator
MMKETKGKVFRRLKILEGQVRGLQRMIDNDVYCIDVLHQSQAIQKALKEVDNLILEHHLATCASAAIREGKAAEAIQEVMNVFKRKGL